MEQKTIPKEILKLREKINKIDGALFLLLDKRLEIVEAVGEIKRRRDLPVLDSSREKEILEKLPRTRNSLFIKNIFKKIFEQSRNIQKKGFVRIATLGPRGTCSENTAREFASGRFLKSEVVLKNNFEECINSVIRGYSDIAIVPSAFKELNELIFRNLGKIRILGSFVFNTPALVLAKGDKRKIKRVATHPAPEVLLERIGFRGKRIRSASNSASALMVVGGKADACVTTEIAACDNRLKIIKNFGEIPMSWNVFVRN